MIWSRLNVAFITSAEDLRNPRIIGRAVGVPSYAALATATSEEAWAAIREERELNGPGPFQFVKKDIPSPFPCRRGGTATTNPTIDVPAKS